MNLFDIPEFKKQIERNANSKIEFRIGVSKTDKKDLCFCLVREINDVAEVLLTKSMQNEIEFDKIVVFLAKCFDAIIIEEKI